MPALENPRLEAAAQLRAAGKRWDEIAPALGYASDNSARVSFSKVNARRRMEEIQAAALSDARLHIISRMEERLDRLGAIADHWQPLAVDGDEKAAYVVFKALQGAAEEVGGRVRHSEHTETTVTITEERRQLIVRRFGRAIEMASKAIDVPGSELEEGDEAWFAGD